MRTAIGLVLLVGCSSSSGGGDGSKLPSATFTPHMQAQASEVACGEDLAFYGNTAPDLRYLFSYDGQGRIQQANGTWTYDGSTEDTVYTWDGWNLTSAVATSSYDGSQWAIAASYDAQDALVDYTWTIDTPDYDDSWTYAFANFVDGAPTQETISQQGQQVAVYDLSYDGDGRLIGAVPDSGPSTVWTYDDAAGTITEDTGNGAFVGVLTYDANMRQLSSSWSGSDPHVIDGDETWDWTGDQLNTVTYRSGSEADPHTLEVVQVATLRYDCAAARQLAGRRLKQPVTRPTMMAR